MTVNTSTDLIFLPWDTILLDRNGRVVWRDAYNGWCASNGTKHIAIETLLQDGAPFTKLVPEQAKPVLLNPREFKNLPKGSKVRGVARDGSIVEGFTDNRSILIRRGDYNQMQFDYTFFERIYLLEKADSTIDLV